MFILCVMGNPISQSKSPLIHKQFAEEFKLEVSYTRIEAPLDAFIQTVEKFKAQGGHGMNITMPFKLEAFALANQLTPRAKIAGAVNTFLFQKNGSIIGDNTDGIGLVTDIIRNLKYSIVGKNILLLGAGGAVRGILFPLLNASPKKIVIANRTIEKASVLAKEFGQYGAVYGCGFNDLANSEFDLVIDGTGFSSEKFILPNSLKLSADSLCYDLKYQSESHFLNWARQNCAKQCATGIGMLVEQAAESFYLWTNKRPQTEKVLELIKNDYS